MYIYKPKFRKILVEIIGKVCLQILEAEHIISKILELIQLTLKIVIMF